MSTRKLGRKASMLAALAEVAALMVIIMVLMSAAAAPVYADEQDEWEGHEPYDLTEPDEYPYDVPDPENNWHDEVLKPGATYDVSDAGWNTTVYLNEPGSYTLKGESNNVRVVINSSDVKLYLADGLNLNCGATTYIGSRSAAINVDVEKETGGTITIISKKNASSYLEGYMAPAIWKAGTRTKLVFDTEDAGSPGSIKAKGGVLSAGIGGVPYAVRTAATTGNIVFSGGYIEAIGSDGGAGIGGGSFGGADGITVNGGSITAYGGTNGAGIGGGDSGDASNLTFSGGTVFAETDNDAGYAAAIGSGGGWAKLAENIVFNGGSISAVSRSGVAIGAGGDQPTLKSLVIRGGTVSAQNKTDWSPGIGAADQGSVESIVIEGGTVNAEGGTGAPGIGVHGKDAFSDSQKLNVKITGGTVRAVKGRNQKEQVNYDIGMDDRVPSGNVNVTITGGSLLSDKVENAKDADGKALHRLEVGFDDVETDGLAVNAADFTAGPVEYGLSQVATNNGGKVYFWVPSLSNAALRGASVDEQTYEGEIKLTESQGTLHKADPGNEDGDYSLDAHIKLVNNGVYIARLNIDDGLYYTDSCAIGQESEVVVHIYDYRREMRRIRFQIWNFGWQDYGIIYIMSFRPGERSGIRYTCSGTIWDFQAGYDWFDPGSSENDPDVIKTDAAIKASTAKVKSGRAATVKVTSDSDSKLTVKASGSKAKKALKKKYVKVTNGKTAKIRFTKKAPKGKYTFKVISPENDRCRKTTRKITINVK